MSQYKIIGLAQATPQYKIEGLASPSNNDQDTSVGRDAGNAVLNLLMAAGNKALNVPQDISSFNEQLGASPLQTTARAAEGIGSEILQGGKDLFNLPLATASYLGKKGFPGFSTGFPFVNSPHTLGQIAENLEIGDTGLEKAVMGKPQPADAFSKDLGFLASLLIGPKALGIDVPPLTSIGAASKLKKAQKILSKRNVTVPVNPDLLQDATQFLPNTNASRQMLEKAAQGDYEAAFSTQSQIGHHERNLKSSPLASERLLAPQARDLKQNILSDMESKLRMQGHHDAADLLKGGVDDYRRYIKVRDNVFPILKMMGIPASVLGILSLGYGTGKKILNSN